MNTVNYNSISSPCPVPVITGGIVVLTYLLSNFILFFFIYVIRYHISIILFFISPMKKKLSVVFSVS